MPDDEVMLEAETDTTIVFEFRDIDDDEDEIGGGGGFHGGFGGGGFGGSGFEPVPTGTGFPDGGGGGGGGGGPSLTIISTEPVTDPGEVDEQLALSLGNGTPEQALAFFQRHGFPELSTLPFFDSGRAIWVFPEPHVSSASGSGHAVGGVTFVTDGGPAASSRGGSTPSGSGTGSASGGSNLGFGGAGGTDSGSSGGAGGTDTVPSGGAGGTDSGSSGGTGSTDTVPSGGAGGTDTGSSGGTGSTDGSGGTDPSGSGSGSGTGSSGTTDGSGSGSTTTRGGSGTGTTDGSGSQPDSAGTPGGPTPAPAPGASPPPPPVPGSIQADFATGMAIGRAHGRFLADADQFMSTLKTEHGGVSLWERMTPAERTAAVERIQRELQNLPQLPKGVDDAHDVALRDGFARTARSSYDASRWTNKAVMVGFELLKGAIIGAAATPPAVGIGAVHSERWSDCAAQTASVALRNAGKGEIDAGLLRANFGLPRTAMGYNDAVAFAKNWFTQLGVNLSPTNAIQDLERGRAAAGDYVMFMNGGPSGGHVVHVTVNPGGTMLITDNQIGLTWTSVMSAQNKLGMQASGAHLITSVTGP